MEELLRCLPVLMKTPDSILGVKGYLSSVEIFQMKPSMRREKDQQAHQNWGICQ